ncbi:MAG: PAS domain-containing protein [Candidatus Omnitrophica bacterium]|nr:PAS domain-containing protein [Candidatus Omnitrophota bacterium]
MRHQFSINTTLTHALLWILIAYLPAPLPVKIAAGCAGLFVLHLHFRNHLKKRIEIFTRAARHYLKNDLGQAPLEGFGDEFDPLVKTLNQTGILLASRIRENETEKKNFSVVLDHMVEGVIAMDQNRQVLLINQAAKTMFRVDSKLSSSKSLLELTFHTELDRIAETAIQEGGLHTQEIELNYPEEKVLNVHMIGIGKTRNEISAILVLHDITKIRQLENLRREFVANVSHEIRTPLTSILGFIETLQSGAGDHAETRNSFLQMMQDDSKRLSRLIDDLLEISKLESREIQLSKNEMSLAKLVDQVLKMLLPRIAEKQIQIQNQIKDQPNLKVLADEDKLKQVLINLIDNAIKFNRDQGFINLRAEILPDHSIRIVIEDQGIGIPESAVPRVFERFFRVDKARSRASGGSGLGLSIVKHIVEAHGGTVACKSILDQGSVFSFTLPLS